jgi:opacity protein-like surface antigen
MQWPHAEEPAAICVQQSGIWFEEAEMRRGTKILIQLTLVAIVGTGLLHAQQQGEDEDFAEDSHLNTNLGAVLSVPLNPLAQFTNFAGGINIGAGYNFNKNHAFVGEFMWNGIVPSDAVIAPIRAALQVPNLSGHANLFALTANYRYELRGNKTGIYFIGGAGIYHRNASLSQEVPDGTAAVCVDGFRFFGITCASGVVTNNVTLASSSSSSYGFNGGIGFTVKVGEPRYRMYIEARYHYAPNMNINTQIIPITIGIRF